jgi:structural maintenance of chromosome 1
MRPWPVQAHAQKAVMHACGNAVVCDGEDEAKTLCYTQGVAKAVSLDGTVIKSSGTMEGGLGGVEGKAHRWEEKHVDTLRHEREQCQEQLNELRSTRRKQQQLETISSKTNGYQSRLQFGEADVKMQRDKLRANAEELAQLQAHIDALQPAMDDGTTQFDADIQRIKASIDKSCQTLGSSRSERLIRSLWASARRSRLQTSACTRRLC